MSNQPYCNFNTAYKGFFNFMSLDTKIDEKLETILSRSIWADNLNNFNDPFEGIVKTETYNKNYVQEIRSSANHRGIFCVCSTELESFKFMSEESTLFWAYYGNANKGICLEYGPEILTHSNSESDLIEIGEVIYNDHQFSFDTKFNDRDKTEDRREILFLKHSCWKHENEVRLIYNEPGRKMLPPNALKAIYCGCRISRANLILAKYLSTELNVRCYILKNNSTEFNFTIHSIEGHITKQIYPTTDLKMNSDYENLRFM